MAVETYALEKTRPAEAFVITAQRILPLLCVESMRAKAGAGQVRCRETMAPYHQASKPAALCILELSAKSILVRIAKTKGPA